MPLLKGAHLKGVLDPDMRRHLWEFNGASQLESWGLKL